MQHKQSAASSPASLRTGSHSRGGSVPASRASSVYSSGSRGAMQRPHGLSGSGTDSQRSHYHDSDAEDSDNDDGGGGADGQRPPRSGVFTNLMFRGGLALMGQITAAADQSGLEGIAEAIRQQVASLEAEMSPDVSDVRFLCPSSLSSAPPILIARGAMATTRSTRRWARRSWSSSRAGCAS